MAEAAAAPVSATRAVGRGGGGGGGEGGGRGAGGEDAGRRRAGRAVPGAVPSAFPALRLGVRSGVSGGGFQRGDAASRLEAWGVRVASHSHSCRAVVTRFPSSLPPAMRQGWLGARCAPPRGMAASGAPGALRGAACALMPQACVGPARRKVPGPGTRFWDSCCALPLG